MSLYKPEDVVRDELRNILGLSNPSTKQSGVGQLYTFKQLGFTDKLITSKKPDGWFLPINNYDVAIICETKNSNESVEGNTKQLEEYIQIVKSKYTKVIGIIYNGYDVLVYKNNEITETVSTLQNKEYYLSLFKENKIDKQKIYNLTKKINDSLHFDFGIKNLYHRMIFTACALVAERYGANLSKIKGMDYPTFHTTIHSTLSKSLIDSKKQNHKLDILLEVYSEIKMNSTENQKAIDNFIDNIVEISDSINSDFWNGEDVMAIFFNEFNRYKGKSESGQVFTPDHITSFMYKLIKVNKDDIILDAACGSGAFLVKAMCNMIKEAGGISTKKALKIKQDQLYGIEFDRQIYALACANMLIHKDGKTNIEHLDTRTDTACEWIKDKPITKVLMNPPFENKYGCIDIVSNVLDNVSVGTICAFILPDKKLEKVGKKGSNLLKHHTLKKIIKLSEKTFLEGITTSVFVFEAGKPQNNEEIFACYIEEDGLETVKNQGRQDIKDKWNDIENYWIDVIKKQSGNETIQWIKPSEHLSYQLPKPEFEIFEEDFIKTVMDYYMFEEKIDVKSFSENLTDKVLYSSNVIEVNDTISIQLPKNKRGNDE